MYSVTFSCEIKLSYISAYIKFYESYFCSNVRCLCIVLVEYNNFEAGEGKSQLDTHFAHVSHKIVRWVRVGNNLETGQQLGEFTGVCVITFVTNMS